MGSTVWEQCSSWFHRPRMLCLDRRTWLLPHSVRSNQGSNLVVDYRHQYTVWLGSKVVGLNKHIYKLLLVCLRISIFLTYFLSLIRKVLVVPKTLLRLSYYSLHPPRQITTLGYYFFALWLRNQLLWKRKFSLWSRSTCWYSEELHLPRKTKVSWGWCFVCTQNYR